MMTVQRTLVLAILMIAICFGANAQFNPASTDFSNTNYPYGGFIGKEFNNGSVEFWNSYKGDADVATEANGNRYASLRYGADMDNGNFYRLGDAVYVNFPMRKNVTYTFSIKMKVSSNSPYARLHKLFFIGDKCLPAITNRTSNHFVRTDANLVIADYPNVGNPGRQIFDTYDGTTNPFSTSWTPYTFSFTPDEDYDQLLILPYKEKLLSQTDVKFELHIDDVQILNQTPRPSAVNFTIPTDICEGDNIYLDGSGTVDNYGHFAYFIEISYINQAGQQTGWQNRWTWGSPACTPVLLNDYYSQAFTANPDGSSRTYYVKLAINSGSNNTWYQLVKTFTVHDKPDFGFNFVPIVQTGTSVYRSVTGLPANGSYSFEWYAGNFASGNIIGTNSGISVGSLVSGNVARTVKVINNNHPDCFTIKTVNTSFMVFRKETQVLSGKKAVDGELKEEISTYPNPSKGIIHVQLNSFDASNSKSLVTVYNQLGQQVISKKFEGTHTTLNLEGNQPGMYYILVEEGSNTYTSKLVLTR